MVLRVNVESGVLLFEGGCQLDEAYGGISRSGLRGGHDSAVLIVKAVPIVLLQDRKLDTVDRQKIVYTQT